MLLALGLIIPTLSSLSGCAAPKKEGETFENVPVYDPSDPTIADGPEVKQSKFKVYWIYKPQVQREDFNGVFTITSKEVRLVSKFWNRRFPQLTRQDYYADFFSEFYDYMHAVANSYPADTRKKEYILGRLEKHFQFFCSNKGIEPQFLKYKEAQQRIFGE